MSIRYDILSCSLVIFVGLILCSIKYDDNIPDIVYDYNQREPQEHGDKLLAQEVHSAHIVLEQAGSGGEHADYGAEEKHQHNDPDHLVSLKAVCKGPYRYSLPAHTKDVLLLP